MKKVRPPLTLLLISVCTPTPVMGKPSLEELRLQLESEFTYFRKLLENNGDCGATQAVGDDLLCFYPDGDSAFYAACYLQQACAFNGDEAPFRVRLLLETVTESGSTQRPDNSLEIKEARALALQLPAGHLFATHAAFDRLSPATRTKFRPADETPTDVPSTRFLFQATCYQEACTRLAIPTLQQDAKPTTKTLSLRWRENRITLNPQSPSQTLGRGSQSDIQIESEYASRTHARVNFQHTNFVLADHSTNGTYVRIEDDDEVFLHLEQIVLRGSGVISLGRRVSSGRGKLIYFYTPTDAVAD